MNDGIDGLVSEQAAQDGALADVADNQIWPLAGDLLDTVNDLSFAVAEVIEDNHFVTRFEQLHDGVRTDVAGTAGNEDGLYCRRHDLGLLCSSGYISYRTWI